MARINGGLCFKLVNYSFRPDLTGDPQNEVAQPDSQDQQIPTPSTSEIDKSTDVSVIATIEHENELIAEDITEASLDWSNSMTLVDEIIKKASSQGVLRHSLENVYALIVTYARCGSSFTGLLLKSHPNSFYHFEPLYPYRYELKTMREIPDKKLLYDLFKCNFSGRKSHLTLVRNHLNQKSYHGNKQFMKTCARRRNIKPCFTPFVMSRFCRNQTLHIIKTIRLSLQDAVKLYENYPDLNLKIIHLVRDPRAVINSRRRGSTKRWCDKNTKCSSVSSYCSEVRYDLNYYCSLKRSGDRGIYFVLRYEDLIENPLNITKSLFKFLGFKTLSKSVIKFLKQSILRFSISGRILHMNSSYFTSHWKQQLSFSDIMSIQENCSDVLTKLNYIMYKNKSQMDIRGLNEYKYLHKANFC
ncbi:carbohydrate sulfotransferase 1-like [Tachypleus tridentatus]|uniref:carbohydrate sulfotransferase 1-like n=1 Tax=Tachypleus tridentatus TaxID=6853 RepID=UPI003FD5C759